MFIANGLLTFFIYWTISQNFLVVVQDETDLIVVAPDFCTFVSIYAGGSKTLVLLSKLVSSWMFGV